MLSLAENHENHRRVLQVGQARPQFAWAAHGLLGDRAEPVPRGDLSECAAVAYHGSATMSSESLYARGAMPNLR